MEMMKNAAFLTLALAASSALAANLGPVGPRVNPDDQYRFFWGLNEKFYPASRDVGFNLVTTTRGAKWWGESDEERARSEEALARQAAEVAALTERLAAAQEGAEGLTLEQAKGRLDQARMLVSIAESGEKDRDAAQAALAAHDEETQIAQGRRVELEQLCASEQARLVALEESLARDEREVDDARGDHPTVQARHDALRTRIASATAVLDALAEVDRATRDRMVRTTELEECLAENGFLDADDARASLLPPEVLAELESTVRRHEAAVERVRVGLADPALADLPDDAPDEAELEARVAAARAEHTALFGNKVKIGT